MAKFFEASEILEFAIRIEENGETFYRTMAKNLSGKDLKEAFNYLADEEVKHRMIFKDMVSRLENYEPAQSFPAEYFVYLRAYADEHIFTKDKLKQIMENKIKTALEAIDFALGAEVDSILYYLEAKNLVPEYQRKEIDKIVEEERRHYLKLTDVKKKLLK